MLKNKIKCLLLGVLIGAGKQISAIDNDRRGGRKTGSNPFAALADDFEKPKANCSVFDLVYGFVRTDCFIKSKIDYLVKSYDPKINTWILEEEEGRVVFYERKKMRDMQKEGVYAHYDSKGEYVGRVDILCKKKGCR